MFNFLATSIAAYLDLYQAGLRALRVMSPLSWMLRFSTGTPAAGKKKPVTNDTRDVILSGALAEAPMYTLQKAKEEIDAIAKHATDIATHSLAMGDNFDAKLESFKKEIIITIEAKFAELEKSIIGDTHQVETSALADLGAKVSQLMQGSAPHAAHGERGPDTGDHSHSGEHDPNAGYQQHDHHQE
jgi:hypothetical protein